MNFVEKIILVLFFLLIFSNKLYAANITADTTYSSDSSGTQYVYTTDDKSVVITNDSTFTRSRKLFIIDDAERSGVSLTIHSGSTVTTTTNSNTIFTDGGDLTITNSGTINADTSKAINVSKSDGVSITNNSGGLISSNGNTILGDAGTGADNSTIQNTGKIFSTESGSESSAIVVADNDTGTTITNNAGGEIYSEGGSSTIILGVSSTLTNSGSIKNNKSVDTNVIQLKGNNNTVTLNDVGVVVGLIKNDFSEQIQNLFSIYWCANRIPIKYSAYRFISQRNCEFERKDAHYNKSYIFGLNIESVVSETKKVTPLWYSYWTLDGF